MTRKELYQFYYIQREIEMWESELERIGFTTSISGTGGSGGNNKPGKPTEVTAIKRAEIIKIIKKQKTKAMKLRTKIYKHIAEIDDSLMRQIVMHRCISLESWNEIARAVGGGNTGNGIRMRFNRQYPK